MTAADQFLGFQSWGIDIHGLTVGCWRDSRGLPAPQEWYIGIAVFSLLYVLADAVAVKLVLPDEPIFGPDTI